MTFNTISTILESVVNPKILIRILINTAIGAVLVFLWLKIVNFHEILEKIKTVEFFAILPFVLFFITSSILRSIRLKILLKDFRVPLKDIIPLTFLSQLFSYLIPLRAGEITKGVYLATAYKVPFSKSIIWILLDRFLDFWLVLVLALALLFVVPTNMPVNLVSTLGIIIAFSTILAAFVVFYPNLAKRLIFWVSNLLVLGVLKKLVTRLSSFIIDTVSLLKRDSKDIVILLAVTLVALTTDAFGWYIFFNAVFSESDFLQIYLGSLFSALTYLIPAAPGYVGSAEASGVAVYSLGLGLDKTLTSVAIVLNHGLTLFCILLFGIISLYVLKFDTSLIWKKFKK